VGVAAGTAQQAAAAGSAAAAALTRGVDSLTELAGASTGSKPFRWAELCTMSTPCPAHHEPHQQHRCKHTVHIVWQHRCRWAGMYPSSR
jgi:hypothetical protein